MSPTRPVDLLAEAIVHPRLAELIESGDDAAQALLYPPSVEPSTPAPAPE